MYVDDRIVGMVCGVVGAFVALSLWGWLIGWWRMRG